MTTKTITGTITNGYTLSSAYSELTITGTGVITGQAGTPGLLPPNYGGPGGAGGRALTVLTAATVTNQGALIGGAGGIGGYGYLEGGSGGAGGGGLYLANGANLTNSGATTGGVGGNGGASEFGHVGRRPLAGGVGGAGGVGVTLAGAGTITNSGRLLGGAGGTDGFGMYNQYMLTPEVNIGGAGVLLTGAGSLINDGGTIAGGAGGSGGTGYYVGAPGGSGGAGILASCGGVNGYQTISNLAGAILGGAGGAGGTGRIKGAAGQVGDGVLVTAPGGVGNYAFNVDVVNGGKTNSTALISGFVGVYGGTITQTSVPAVTVINYGTIQGTGGVAVSLHCSADRLVDEAGSTLIGTAIGGRGILELGAGTGTISGLGTNFTGFADMIIDSGGSWTLSGTNNFAGFAGVALENGASLNGGLTLGGPNHQLVLAPGASIIGLANGAGGQLQLPGASLITGLGATGTVSGGASATFSGFGAYSIGQGAYFNGIDTVGANHFLAVADGVHAGISSALTLTNSGKIVSGAAASVLFNSAKDRLIAEAGSSIYTGSVLGGDGTLELAGGSGTITGLGVSGTLSGAVTMTFSGFGHYLIDAGGAWTLSGTNTLGAGQTLTNAGALTGGVTLTSSSARVIAEAGSTLLGAAQGGGGTLELAGGSDTVTGLGSTATLSGATAMTFSGFGSYVIDTGTTLVPTGTNTFGANQTLTNFGHLNGILTLGAASDRVVVESGSFTELVNGGGGGVELAGVTGIIQGLGSTATLSGAISGKFRGFGSYFIDAGGAWTLSGTNTLGAGQTLTNAGALSGGMTLTSSSARVVVETGSTWTGAVAGGGGTLELASGTGTISGLGATGTISGTEAMTFSGFGTYQLDTGTSWTLVGVSSLAPAQSLTLASGATLSNNGTLTSAGALTLSGVVSGPGTLAISGGTAAINTGAAMSVAHLTLTGGVASLGETLTYKGAFTEGAAATVTLGSKNKLTLSGAATLSGLINGAGTVVLANATVSGLTIGGTDVLSVTGKVMQTGALTIGDATTAKASLSIAAGATWTINGAVGIAHGAATKSSLKVAGTLIKSGATGTSTINLVTTDTGVIEAAAGTLDFSGKLSGTGVLKIDAGATLEADAATARTLTATFNGATATLAIKTAATFAATIAGFAVGDTIDLLGRKATGASINAADQLVIVNGARTVATLQLSGTYVGATFNVGTDTHGGTNVTLLTAAMVSPPAGVFPAPSTQAMVAAMTGLGAEAGSAIAATPRDESWRPTLLGPRAQLP